MDCDVGFLTVIVTVPSKYYTGSKLRAAAAFDFICDEFLKTGVC